MASERKKRKQLERVRKKNHARETWKSKRLLQEKREEKKRQFQQQIKDTLGFDKFKFKGKI